MGYAIWPSNIHAAERQPGAGTLVWKLKLRSIALRTARRPTAEVSAAHILCLTHARPADTTKVRSKKMKHIAERRPYGDRD
jgi:hypothetical protein